MSDSEKAPSFEPSRTWLVINGILVTLMVAMTVLIWTSTSAAWNWIPGNAWEEINAVARVGGPVGAAFCLGALRRVSATVEHRLLRLAFVLLNIVGLMIGLSSLVYS